MAPTEIRCDTLVLRSMVKPMTKDLPVTVRLPSDLIERLDVVARRWNWSRSHVIRKAIERLVEVEERGQVAVGKGFTEIVEGRGLPWDDLVDAELRQLADSLNEMDRRARGGEVAE